METFSALLAICAGNSPVQLREALMFSLISAWINSWVNNRQAGDLRRHCGHYDVIVMKFVIPRLRLRIRVEMFLAKSNQVPLRGVYVHIIYNMSNNFSVMLPCVFLIGYCTFMDV